MLTQTMTLRSTSTQAGAGTYLGSGSNNGLVKFNNVFSQIYFTLNVTAAATDVGDLLDVYIDTSFDGGSTWVNVGRFTQVLGNGGAKKYHMVLVYDYPANAVWADGDLASAGTRQVGFGDRIRYRSIVTDAGTANASFTYAITAFAK